MTTSTPTSGSEDRALISITTTVGHLAPGYYGYLRTRKGSLFRTDEALAVHAEAQVQSTDDGTGPYCHRITRHVDGTYSIALISDPQCAPRVSYDSLAVRRARGENIVVIDTVNRISPLTHLTRLLVENSRVHGYGPALSVYCKALASLCTRALKGNR